MRIRPVRRLWSLGYRAWKAFRDLLMFLQDQGLRWLNRIEWWSRLLYWMNLFQRIGRMMFNGDVQLGVVFAEESWKYLT